PRRRCAPCCIVFRQRAGARSPPGTARSENHLSGRSAPSLQLRCRVRFYPGTTRRRARASPHGDREEDWTEMIKPRAESISKLAGRLRAQEHSGSGRLEPYTVLIKLALFLLAALISGIVTFRVVRASLSDLIAGAP